MRIEMHMNKDEDKFYVNGWWASSPEFVMAALSAQLKAAAVIFPELNRYLIGVRGPEVPAPQEEVALTTGQGSK